MCVRATLGRLGTRGARPVSHNGIEHHIQTGYLC